MGSRGYIVQLLPCPQCGEMDAGMGSSAWGHAYSCCSDACGHAYADSLHRWQRELDSAVLLADGAASRVARIREHMQRLRDKGPVR